MVIRVLNKKNINTINKSDQEIEVGLSHDDNTDRHCMYETIEK